MKILYSLFVLAIILNSFSCNKFGQDGPFLSLDTTEDLPTKVFFNNYVKNKKAVLIKNGCKQFPAVKLWSDEYLLNKSHGFEDLKLTVETVKKETRNQNVLGISFKEFLQNYLTKSYYLVNDVPYFLKQDIILPQPLQCEQAVDTLDQTLMWFSSGNTSSVTHTDDYENILCVIDGRKDLILVDYYKNEELSNIIIDVADGSYSSMDVDNVDYSKFPGIEQLEYYSASLNAGDCLYIPFRWIHQVRSYDRNIAVNFWFNSEKIYNNNKFSDECSKNKFEMANSLDKITIKTEDNELNGFKYFIIRQIKNGYTKQENWKRLILKDIDEKHNLSDIPNLENLINEFFNLLDFNGNGEIELDELEIEQNTMEQISDIFQEIDSVVKTLRLNDDDDNQEIQEEEENYYDVKEEL